MANNDTSGTASGTPWDVLHKVITAALAIATSPEESHNCEVEY
jgi:hypothetical protein